jgi:hypothetical protein
MTVLGLALVVVSANVMERQSTRDGMASAESVQSYATGQVPTDSFVLATALTPEQDAAVRAAVAGFADSVVEVRLWAQDGTLIFSTADRTTSGFPDGDRLDATMRTGEPDA